MSDISTKHIETDSASLAAPAAAYDAASLTDDIRSLGRQQYADGVTAWKQMLQVVLAEGPNMQLFAESLREAIAVDALTVYKDVVMPLVLRQSQQQVSVVGRVDVHAMIKDMLKTTVVPATDTDMEVTQ